MPVLTKETLLESLLSSSKTSKEDINKYSFLDKKLSCEFKNLFFKLMNINVMEVSGLSVKTKDCNCLKNTIPFTQDCEEITGCCINHYISGSADIGYRVLYQAGVPDNSEITYNIPSHLVSSNLINKIDWKWTFFQGGIVIDSNQGSVIAPVPIVTPHIENIPFAGAGVYWIKVQYEDTQNYSFSLQKLVQVDNNGIIVQYVTVSGIEMSTIQCRNISLKATITNSNSLKLGNTFWGYIIDSSPTPVATGVKSVTISLPDSSTPTDVAIFFSQEVITSNWPDVDFNELDTDGVVASMSLRISCDAEQFPTTTFLDISYDCESHTLSGNITSPDSLGNDFYLQISPNGNDNWVNIRLIPVQGVDTQFEVPYNAVNGSWWFRIRNAADTAGSDVINIVPDIYCI